MADLMGTYGLSWHDDAALYAYREGLFVVRVPEAPNPLLMWLQGVAAPSSTWGDTTHVVPILEPCLCAYDQVTPPCHPSRHTCCSNRAPFGAWHLRLPLL